MLKKIKLNKYKHTIAALLLVILYSCSELGNQPPENVVLMASDDGAVIIRQYSIFNVTSYSKRGNSTRRYGSTTNYLEAFDGTTGEAVSKQAFKLKGNYKLIKVTNKHALLKYYNIKKNNQELLIVNIPQFSKAFDEAALSAINNGLIFNPTYTYYNPTGIPGIILKADDARLYALDEKSGKAILLPDSVDARMINRRFLQLSNIEINNQLLNFTGSRRKKIVATIKGNNTPNAALSSAIDFINPYFVGYYFPQQNKELPLRINNGLLIVSKTKDSNTFEFILTLIDGSSLQTNWSVTLKNEKGESSENDLLDIQLHGSNLLVITKNSMNLLDTKSGQWKWNKHFN